MASIIIAADGQVRAIHDDELRPALAELGPITTRRASDVEPDGDCWRADMTRVGGPLLGLHAARRDALNEEAAWLLAHDIPMPEAV